MDFDERRKKMPGFFKFDEFDKMFDQLMEGFDRDFERLPAKPIVYGFSMKVGPDGRPHFEEFGNVQRGEDGLKLGAREPLVNVGEEKGKVTITAELPGVEKKDIKVDAKENWLSITVSGEKLFYKEIVLDSNVDEKTIEANFKNGILEITAKTMPRKSDSKRVEIK